MKRMELRYWCRNIFIPLCVGVIVYFVCRPDSYISRILYRSLKMDRQLFASLEVLPGWLRVFLTGFLADILWAYALTFTVSMIWRKEGVWILPTIICVVFEVGIEFSQGAGLISGTFDWLDMLFEVCATALATLQIKNARSYRNEEY